jgi:hypothetical protein
MPSQHFTHPAITAATLFLILLSFAPASAASFTETDYRAAMENLDTIETLITDTSAHLAKGMSQQDARTALPHLKERLQWMRNIKVTAARADQSHTLRTRNPDAQRAQCIIMRSGLMDAGFQDVMVNVSMKARGAADDALIPASAAPPATSNATFHCGSL